jgi:hypothetical protein
MKLRNLFGLAAIGGLVYLHRKRGGEFTVDSFKDSARQLWDGIQRAADHARKDADRRMREGAREVGRVADEVGRVADDVSKHAKGFGTTHS